MVSLVGTGCQRDALSVVYGRGIYCDLFDVRADVAIVFWRLAFSNTGNTRWRFMDDWENGLFLFPVCNGKGYYATLSV